MKQDLIELHSENKNSDENQLRIPDKEDLTIMNLFTPKEILFRTLNMFYQWFTITLCYYGLSFSSTHLLGDPHTNFCLSVLIEIPGFKPSKLSSKHFVLYAYNSY